MSNENESPVKENPQYQKKKDREKNIRGSNQNWRQYLDFDEDD
jgi:hypothetical protein